jgi:predicted TIM-barrel fold metal-dependent hydrolase
MSEPVHTFSPRAYGLPSREDLVAHRIWDMHYHGMDPAHLRGGKSLVTQNEEAFEFVDRMGVELVCPFLHVGLGTATGDRPSAENDRQIEEALTRWRQRLAGHVWLSPRNVQGSLQAIDRWIANGPMVGLKFGNSQALPASHPNFDPLIERAAELQASIYIHAWFHVTGEPRAFGGRKDTVSNPQDLVVLAKRFPSVSLICGHAGGDWESGVRTVRPYKNILLEFSGSDPHSGSVDFAVRELGAERVLWGGHIPSRSYSNEMSKIFDADISDAQRKLILGGNLRRLLAPILRKKGVAVTI